MPRTSEGAATANWHAGEGLPIRSCWKNFAWWSGFVRVEGGFLTFTRTLQRYLPTIKVQGEPSHTYIF